jgi:hypothetical protein
LVIGASTRMSQNGFPIIFLFLLLILDDVKVS